MSLIQDLKKVLAEGKLCKINLKNLKENLNELMRGDNEKFLAELDLLKINLEKIVDVLNKYSDKTMLKVATISPAGMRTDYDFLEGLIEGFSDKLEIILINIEAQLTNEETMIKTILSRGNPQEVNYLFEKIALLRDLANRI